MSVSAQLGAQRFAHRRDGPLGGRVERARQGAPAGDRARSGQCPEFCSTEVAERRANRERRPEDVRVTMACQCSRGLLEEAAAGAEAGVGKGGVDPAEALERFAPAAAGRPSSVTSQRTASAWSAPSSSASAASLSSERAARTSPWPNSTARRAVAAPIPVLAPVMTITGSSATERVSSSRRKYPGRTVDATEARFPRVRPSNGHYESWYLKACIPRSRAACGSATRCTSGPGSRPPDRSGSRSSTRRQGDRAPPR